MGMTADEYRILRAHMAVHEAGHAVAAIEQGMPVALIVMSGEGDPGERTAAYTNFGEHAAYELMAAHPDAMGPVQLAGKCAETHIFDGRHVRGGYERDLAVIQSHTGSFDSTDEAFAVLLPWTERAREIVRERRDAIETVAAELMTAERLTREQIDDLIEQSRTAPRRLPPEVMP